MLMDLASLIEFLNQRPMSELAIVEVVDGQVSVDGFGPALPPRVTGYPCSVQISDPRSNELVVLMLPGSSPPLG